ncbi:hypothetical protein ACUM6W_02630 [Acinetobacter tandoii]|uniref:hypothetical protein n=1 Tax=Acinetobacter tandoii TaxID=202954 RepID=UPI0040452434
MASKHYELSDSDNKYLSQIATNRAKGFLEGQTNSLKEILYRISASQDGSKVYATIFYDRGVKLDGNITYFPRPATDSYERKYDVHRGYIWQAHFLAGD